MSDYFLIGSLDKALKQTSNQDKAIGDMYSKDLRARETLKILFLFLVYIIYILGTNRKNVNSVSFEKYTYDSETEFKNEIGFVFI